MKIQERVAGGFGLLAVLTVLSAGTMRCTPEERLLAKTVVDAVLSASQIACLESSTLSSSPDVVAVCNVDLKAAPSLLPVVDQLLAQKAAAKRVGFVWNGAPADAGSLP